MNEVMVVMGSESDWNIMKPAYQLLVEFGVKCGKRVVSAHRTPELF